MYWLTKLAQNKLLVAIMLSMALSLTFGSIALAVGAGGSCASATCDTGLTCNSAKICVANSDDGDTFGLSDFQEGLGQDTLGNEDLRTTIGRIINVALSLLGVVAVVIVLLGGFKWMTAGGNEEKATEARKLIFAGIIGLAIILSAWAITIFVLKNLSEATNPNAGGIPSEFQ